MTHALTLRQLLFYTCSNTVLAKSANRPITQPKTDKVTHVLWHMLGHSPGQVNQQTHHAAQDRQGDTCFMTHALTQSWPSEPTDPSRAYICFHLCFMYVNVMCLHVVNVSVCACIWLHCMIKMFSVQTHFSKQPGNPCCIVASPAYTSASQSTSELPR